MLADISLVSKPAPQSLRRMASSFSQSFPMNCGQPKINGAFNAYQNTYFLASPVHSDRLPREQHPARCRRSSRRRGHCRGNGRQPGHWGGYWGRSGLLLPRSERAGLSEQHALTKHSSRLSARLRHAILRGRTEQDHPQPVTVYALKGFMLPTTGSDHPSAHIRL